MKNPDRLKWYQRMGIPFSGLTSLPVILLFVLLSALSCKSESRNATPDEPNSSVGPPLAGAGKNYPAELSTVFKAHGGLDAWKSKRTLIYDIPKGSVTETHTIDLQHRLDRIDTEAFSMGYDGKGTWILDPKGAYEGNPEFYHNLMFYFYAMPFVLADPGIQYTKTPDLEFEGKSYPGLRISYGDGVGTSPEDEYFIHYDRETGRMEWLGYTVTYHSGQKSDNVKWIRYDDWDSFDGLILPRSISWYNYQGRTIEDLRNTVRFENIRISELQTDPERFRMPEKASYFKP